MQARSYKLLLELYKKTILSMVWLNLIITVYGGRFITNKFDISVGYFIAGLISFWIDVLAINRINRKMYKTYQKRLQADALQMTELLRMNHLGNPEVLDKLIMELKQANILSETKDE